METVAFAVDITAPLLWRNPERLAWCVLDLSSVIASPTRESPARGGLGQTAYSADRCEEGTDRWMVELMMNRASFILASSTNHVAVPR
jgi:hypothetical protein